MKKLLTLLLICLTLLVNAQSGMLNGSGYAPDITVTDINGNTHNLYNYLDSGRVVVLELMSVTCGYCQSHAAGTENSYQTNGPSGTNIARFLGLEVNSSTDSAAVANFASTYGVTFPIVNNVSPTAINYQLYYTPGYYVIYPDRTYTTICALYCVTAQNYSTIEGLLNTAIAAWVPPVYGCTDSLAINYNPLANITNDSCDYTSYTITTVGMSFSPDTIICDVGDTINFILGGGYHNAVEVSDSIWLIGGTTSNGGFSFGYGATGMFIPDQCHTYYYICQPHASSGMKGVIIAYHTPVYGCTDSTALNYSPLATIDDSSCCGNIGASWNQLGQDVDGEAANDKSGWSVSMSSDGTIMAIGAHNNDGNGTDAGHVRIYAYNESSWNQIGNDIDGEAAGDASGYSVSLSSDGSKVAIGALYNFNTSASGYVRIYENIGGSWIQIGQDIDGEAAYDNSGYSVSLSHDGNTVAIGATGNDGNGTDAGHVRIYNFDGSSWNKLGDDIDGEATYDQSGRSVSLSSDGGTVAIGAPYNAGGNGSNSGHVRIYNYNSNSWHQLGQDIDGEAAYDASGGSISLSNDGSIIAIGANHNDGNGMSSGHVRIYNYNGTNWIQLGQDLDGEAAFDNSGRSVSLSGYGNIVAIGAYWNVGNGSDAGHVRIYHYNGTSWNQTGNDIDGEAAYDQSGSSVSLSSDGNRVAIGALYNSGNGTDAGHVRVYSLTTPCNNLGCLDSLALNYDPTATFDDGSCLYPIYGCTDSTATNYNPNATIDNGSCIYPAICANAAPTGLHATNVVQNRATINWDNMNDANCMVDQYRIKFRAVGSSTFTQKTMGQPVNSCLWAANNTDKLILNLTPSTQYEYQMKAWYCDGFGNGVASAWSSLHNFTTEDDCPNVGNLTVTTGSPTQATFTWDGSNGTYSFTRIKARVDTNNGVWFNVGGTGVNYGTFTKNKNGLNPGTSYRAQARTWCDPNGGAWKSPQWTSLVYWTQPTIRLEGGNTIANLEVYPNPSKDVFNVTFTSEEVQNLKVKVLNVIGEELISDNLQQFIGEYTKQINLSNNAKGIYFLEIETNNGVINKKLILQ